jgi:hypothetical protein
VIRDQRAAVVPVRVGLLIDPLACPGLEQPGAHVHGEAGVLQRREQLIRRETSPMRASVAGISSG